MKFEAPEIQVIAFEVKDIITVSDTTSSTGPTEIFNPGLGGVGNGDGM